MFDCTGNEIHHRLTAPKVMAFSDHKPTGVIPISPIRSMSLIWIGIIMNGCHSNYHRTIWWWNKFTDNTTINIWIMCKSASLRILCKNIWRNSRFSRNQPNSLYMSQNGGMNNLPQMPCYPQNYFAAPNIYNSPVLQQQNNQPQPQVPQPQVAAQPQQVPQQPLPDQQPNPAQQRFPNIVQEEVENRDWLDMFYAFSRLMVLVTLVYFYSSPLRCLIVIFFTILYYG